jgi:ribosomal protein L11 methyltransferase
MIVKNNISKSKDKFDIIIANILAEPLVALAPFLIDKLDKNGIIGLSGILKDQVDYVKESYADFISINSPEYYEEWSFLNGSFNK